jgi:hypothetical protein
VTGDHRTGAAPDACAESAAADHRVTRDKTLKE